MKRRNLISRTAICLYLVLAVVIVTGCSKPVNEKTFNLSMQKINGEWINASYSLPDDAYFFINTHRGSYSLRYDRRSATWWNKSTSGIIVRNGIIDYKVNNR